MKIAVPVADESLTIYPNAGHAPYFAVFSVKGGMFKSYQLEELKANPRTDIEHDDCDGEHGHSCQHDHHEGDEDAHIAQHKLMASVISDCHYLVVKRACKNTMLGMTKAGLKVVRYAGQADKAPTALAQMSAQLV